MQPKPCPYCGARADTIDSPPDEWWAACLGDCALLGPTMPTEAEAIAAWNRLAGAVEDAKRLRAAIQAYKAATETLNGIMDAERGLFAALAESEATDE